MGDTCCPGSPIIVDLAGDGIHLTGADDGVIFRLHPDVLGQWAWTQAGSDDAFLALDINGNGQIDDGSELFGDGAVQIASDDPNGFSALAYYDRLDQGGDNNGVIDSRDAVWSRLRLWRDVDHNAISSPDELITLADAGVRSLNLAYTKESVFDEHGNESRFLSTIMADSPVSQTVVDVWLQQTQISGAQNPTPSSCTTTVTCGAWSWAVASDLDPNTGINPACSIAKVSTADIATVDGHSYRFVYAVGFGGDVAAAQDQAYESLITRMKGPDGYCLFGPIFAHDPFPASGFSQVQVLSHGPLAPWNAFEYKITCSTSTTCTPGGGGGCN